MKKTIWLLAMLLFASGCGNPSIESTPGNPAEFTVTHVPTDGQGHVLKIVGRGKTCYYYDDNNYSGSTLWCEDTK